MRGIRTWRRVPVIHLHGYPAAELVKDSVVIATHCNVYREHVAYVRAAQKFVAQPALFAGLHPGNAASRRTLEKLGFLYTHHEPYAPTGLDHPGYLLAKGLHDD